MSKEVFLMADIPDLGREGDVVKVADGYARNYLMPKKLAAPVTSATKRQLEKKQRERSVREASELEGANALARTIEQASCTIAVKTGPEGKLFGSVSVADVVANLKEQGITLDKHQIEMPDAIRETGVFKLTVKVHPKVQCALKVWVVEE
ncbi:MAG: 50S ribosomal protein L9 [Spartobacteria bacterium]|nr:50S ribosomal protein L9 [Spartobacteria bacterium]